MRARSVARSESDHGREALYAAELAAFDGTGYEAIVPLDELVESARAITSAEWWPCGAIEVVATRSDARSSRTRYRTDGPPTVRIAAGQCTPATLLHELAHVLAGAEAGHGPRFRRAYLDLVRFCWGDQPAGWLRAAFDVHHLAVGERAWATPPTARTQRGPIAL